MKKKILLLTTSVILSMGLAGCASNSASNSFSCLANDFTVVEEKESNFLGDYSQIIYDNETKVEYLIIYDGYRCGITPIYNADGTIKVYQEK